MTENKTLVNILKQYIKIYKRDINYPLFNIIVLAFLKENNESLETLEINKECCQELYSFIEYILINKHDKLNNIIFQYNKVT